MDRDFSDMMSKFADMMGNSDHTENFNYQEDKKNNNPFNFDIMTLAKLKSVMDKMNAEPDTRGNLLRSLKPYLRENRQAKVDQYINLFNVSKIMELLKQTGGDGKWMKTLY